MSFLSYIQNRKKELEDYFGIGKPGAGTLGKQVNQATNFVRQNPTPYSAIQKPVQQAVNFVKAQPSNFRVGMNTYNQANKPTQFAGGMLHGLGQTGVSAGKFVNRAVQNPVVNVLNPSTLFSKKFASQNTARLENYQAGLNKVAPTTTTGEVGSFVGEQLPYLAIPMGGNVDLGAQAFKGLAKVAPDVITAARLAQAARTAKWAEVGLNAGKNALIGAGFGGAQSYGEGGNVKDVLKSAGMGAATAAGLGLAGEGVSAVVGKIAEKIKLSKAIRSIKDPAQREAAILKTEFAPGFAKIPGTPPLSNEAKFDIKYNSMKDKRGSGTEWHITKDGKTIQSGTVYNDQLYGTFRNTAEKAHYEANQVLPYRKNSNFDVPISTTPKPSTPQSTQGATMSSLEHARAVKASADIGGMQSVGKQNLNVAEKTLQKAGEMPTEIKTPNVTKDYIKNYYETKKPPVVGDVFINAKGERVEITSVRDNQVQYALNGKNKQIAGNVYLDKTYGATTTQVLPPKGIYEGNGNASEYIGQLKQEYNQYAKSLENSPTMKPISFDEFVKAKSYQDLSRSAVNGTNVPLTPENAQKGIQASVTPPQNGKITATRSFPKTVKQSELVSPEVSKTVKNQLYTVRDTEELGAKAKNLVDTYPNIALDMADSPKIDDQVVAVSNELIKKYSYSTNPAEVQMAVDLTEKLAPKLTEAGRAIQAASLINRLSPEGVLVFTQRQLNKAVKINPKFEGKISNETALKLTEMTKTIQKMPDGYEKTLKTAQLYKEIQDLIPVSIGKKIATLQTMAQLLNPKTIVRNLVGNTGFAGQEAISQTLATPIDRLVGLFTGKKTVSLPNLATQGKSYIKAGGQAAREAGLGVNTSNLTSQFELNQVPAFKNEMLATAEKGLNYALRVPDRAAYSAAFDDTLQGLMKTNKVTKPEEWMLEAAHQTGLYRTFQDSSNTAKLFTKIKSGLNFGKDFGLGDFVLKYPKTPANIISRGIDYSPAGYVKALYNLAFIKNPANQREFSMGLARATTGTASLVGLGALLGGMGIITEAPQKDTDLRNLQKKVGLGGYQINLSALKRYFNSGFNKNATELQQNDTLVTYDWFQPAAIGLSMGAKIANNMKTGKNVTNDLTGIITESINSGVSTLSEQPMVRGITNLVAGYGGLVENLKDTATQSLASFVPTISNQLAQLIDTDQFGHTKVRDVSSLSFIDETIKRIQTKIPFLREKLPQSVDVMGDPMVYSSKAGVLSTFVTPYFLSNYSPTPEIKELFNLMDVTGEKKQFPRTVDQSIDINGKSLKLAPEQKRGYQTYVGQKTSGILSQLLNDPRYTSLDDTGKVNRISEILTDINAAAKIELFGNQPKIIDAGVKAILAGNYYMGKEPTTAKVKNTKAKKTVSKKVKSGKKANFAKLKTTMQSIPQVKATGMARRARKVKLLYAKG